MIIMLHSNDITNGIGTQKCVYRHSNLGNLDRTQIGEIVSFSPLQDRFYSDGKACLSIAVNFKTTFAFIQGVISRMMSIVHCTAANTPFGRVVSINFVKRYLEHFGVGFKELLEFAVRDSVDFLVGFFVKLSFSAAQVLQFLNSNISTIRLGKVYNFFSDLTASCLDKVSLFSFELTKASSRSMRTFIRKTFEIIPSLYKSPLSFSNIPTKVKLPDNFGSLGIKHAHSSKSGRADVDTKNISLAKFGLLEFLFKNNRDSSVLQERYVVKNPSIRKKKSKPFKLVVSSDRNHKGLFWRVGNLKAWIVSFGLNILEPSFIETNRTLSKLASFAHNIFSALPNVLTSFLNNVTWKARGFAYA